MPLACSAQRGHTTQWHNVPLERSFGQACDMPARKSVLSVALLHRVVFLVQRAPKCARTTASAGMPAARGGLSHHSLIEAAHGGSAVHGMRPTLVQPPAVVRDAQPEPRLTPRCNAGRPTPHMALAVTSGPGPFGLPGRRAMTGVSADRHASRSAYQSRHDLALPAIHRPLPPTRDAPQPPMPRPTRRCDAPPTVREPRSKHTTHHFQVPARWEPRNHRAHRDLDAEQHRSDGLALDGVAVEPSLIASPPRGASLRRPRAAPTVRPLHRPANPALVSNAPCKNGGILCGRGGVFRWRDLSCPS